MYRTTPGNIKVEYKLSKKEIQKENEECNLGFGFDDTFKNDNQVFFYLYRGQME